jgi:hypothetical protein
MKEEPFQRPDCADLINEKHPVVAIRDKVGGKSELRYENVSQSRLTKYRIDGCLLPEEAGKRKCDYLLLNIDLLKAYFIELKGSDLDSAVEQIDIALSRLNPTLKAHAYVPHGQIVLTRVNTTDRQSLKFRSLMKRFKNLSGTLEKTGQKKIIRE